MRKRVKVEFQDDNGSRYTLAVEGRISKEKVLKIMDLMELIEGPQDNIERPIDESTVFGKLFKIIEETYAGRDFSSADIARDFEERYTEAVGLSTVSTYLSRLTGRGVLKRQKFGNSWIYRMVHLQTGQVPSK